MYFSADFILVWILILSGLVIYGKVFKSKTVIEVEDPMTIEEQITRIIDGYLTNADLKEWDEEYEHIPKHIIDMLREISPLLGDMDLDFMIKVERRAHYKIDYVEYLTQELIYEFNENKL